MSIQKIEEIAKNTDVKEFIENISGENKDPKVLAKCEKCGEPTLLEFSEGRTRFNECSCQKEARIKTKIEKFKELSITSRNSGKDNFTQDVKEFKDANPNYMEYLTEDEVELYKILKEWRAGEAQLLGYPPYIIASNQLLANIAKTNPKNMEELSQLKGMGKRKIRDYGEEILLILENFYDMKS